MIRQFLQIMSTVLVSALCSLPCASQTYTTGTSYPLIVVANGPGDQSDPHVSGHYAVYTDAQGNTTNTIKYFDFANQTTGIVPQGAGVLDSLSDVSGGSIVFTRVDLNTGSSAIYSYPIGGTLAEVAPVAIPLRRNPAVGGPTIAWEDSGVSTDAYPELVVDSGGTVTQLSSDLPADQNPSVSPDGSTVVWEKCAASCDVYAAVKAGSSWNVSQITNTAANETSPDTNGTIVVYASDANGSSHVHFRLVSGGPDQTITMPPGWVYENHPAIAGNFIAFEAADGVQTDLWVYDMSAGTLRQITNTAANEMLADVSSSTTGGTTTITVVWQVTLNDTNVYATQFQGTPATPFSAFSAKVVADVNQNAFAITGSFKLGTGSNGIAPLTETVQLQVGSYSTTIPAGSFASNGLKGFQFIDIANNFAMAIQPIGTTYIFAAAKKGSTPGPGPSTNVMLAIGDDSGTVSAPVFWLSK